MNPTSELYQSLQHAYDRFNERLFESSLPPVIFTVQRKPGVMGYFTGDRWCDTQGKIVSEIAINPSYIASSRLIEVMQTLVHEMVHCWQHFHGNPSRRFYHNVEWAKKMIAVGLMPSSTGEPGGKITGQFMGDYILKDGPFLSVFKVLEEKNELGLAWVDRKALPRLYEPTIAGPSPDPIEAPIPVETSCEGFSVSTNISDLTSDTLELSAGSNRAQPTSANAFFLDANALLPSELQIHETPKRKTRVRYQCPGCDVIVYGRPKLSILCGDCDHKLEGET